jgi:serine/threonine-protein kinase
MQKDPADRFQTADELSRTLRDYLSGRTSSVEAATRVLGSTPQVDRTKAMPQVERPLPAGATVSAARSQQRSATEEAEERSKKSKRRLIAGIIAGVVALIAVIAIATTILGSGSETQAIPNLYGLTQQQAAQSLEDSGFELGDVKEEYSDEVDSGLVMDQNPDANQTATKGTKVGIVISKGKKPAESVTVPDLSNMTRSEAEAALTKVGLVGENGDPVYSDNVAADHVAQQDTAAGATAKEGDTVVYHLSKGVESVDVPDVTGMTASQAEAAIENAGLTASGSVGRTASSSSENGLVYWQSPSSGTADKGSTVTFYYYGDYVAPESPTSPTNPTSPTSPTDSDSSSDGTTSS